MRTKNYPTCPDCNGPVSSAKTKRCRSCSAESKRTGISASLVVNGPEAVERLVDENAPLAFHMAGQRRDIDHHDALSLAFEALWHAAQKWNGSIPFGTYAAKYMNWKFAASFVKASRKCRGGEATIFSLEIPKQFDDGAGTGTALDFVDQAVFEAQGHEPEPLAQDFDVEALLARLDDRKREVIRRRFGIRRDRQTMDEIKVLFGVSRERVRQIEEEALSKLRSFALAAGDEDYEKVAVGGVVVSAVNVTKEQARQVALSLLGGVSATVAARAAGIGRIRAFDIYRQVKAQRPGIKCRCSKQLGHSGACRVMARAA